MKKQEMKLIYWSVFLMGFAESMIIIFVPLYLYKLNYPIYTIIFYYILSSLAFVIFSLIGAKGVSKVGIKNGILISAIFLIGYYLLLNQVAASPIVFFILPVILSLKGIFYNYGFHLNFLLNSCAEKRGRQLSYVGIENALATALGPMVAGVIVSSFGFNILFSLGAVLLVLGALILFFSKINYKPDEIDVRLSLKYFLNKKNWRNFVSFTGYAIEASINREIWPIYLLMLFLIFLVLF